MAIDRSPVSNFLVFTKPPGVSRMEIVWASELDSYRINRWAKVRFHERKKTWEKW
jgi:hypothetical protein